MGIKKMKMALIVFLVCASIFSSASGSYVHSRLQTAKDGTVCVKGHHRSGDICIPNTVNCWTTGTHGDCSGCWWFYSLTKSPAQGNYCVQITWLWVLFWILIAGLFLALIVFLIVKCTNVNKEEKDDSNTGGYTGVEGA